MSRLGARSLIALLLCGFLPLHAATRRAGDSVRRRTSSRVAPTEAADLKLDPAAEETDVGSRETIDAPAALTEEIAAEPAREVPASAAAIAGLSSVSREGGAAGATTAKPRLILPSEVTDGEWASLGLLAAAAKPALMRDDGKFFDPNARLFDAIRALRNGDAPVKPPAEPSAGVLANLVARRDEYLEAPLRDAERVYADAIVDLMRERGIPAQTQKHVEYGWPHYFAVALPDLGGHWLSKTAMLLVGSNRNVGIAPEFSQPEGPAGQNVPDWGVLLQVAELDEARISPTTQHELGHHFMDEGVRHDQEHPGEPPISRVSITARRTPEFTYAPGVVPARFLDALARAREWRESFLERLKGKSEKESTTLEYLIEGMSEHYGHRVSLEETWTHLISTQGHADAAVEEGVIEANRALFGVVQGWMITGLAESLLREALDPAGFRVAKKTLNFEGDREVKLRSGARLVLHSAQVNRGGPIGLDRSLDPATYLPVFRQSLKETLTDRRAYKALGDAILKLLDQRKT